MSNRVTVNGISYLGAGAKFGIKVFTRDIAYSGILGLNRTHPMLMRESLRFTRDLRLRLGLKVSSAYALPGKDLPFEVLDMDEATFVETHHTNGFCRRTDDVIWLWAYRDLIGAEANRAEKSWLFNTGRRCFSELYDPFFDLADGLYGGQASFIDIDFPTKKNQATGYPKDWDYADSLLIKATCTNSLYQKGLRVMQELAEDLDDPSALEWKDRADAHRKAMARELINEQGHFHYYKLPDGSLEPRRNALGSALAVLCGVVEGPEAIASLKDYPQGPYGIPLIAPPRDFGPESYYHNNASWPFVDALFCWAQAQATGEDNTPYAAAIAARTCRPDGTFHEVVRLPDGDVRCSASQLWSAAGFINTCIRAHLVEDIEP